MKRIERIEKLEKMSLNIDITSKKIKNIRESIYYKIFGNKDKQERDIEIQVKCLAYWKNKFNRELELLKV